MKNILLLILTSFLIFSCNKDDDNSTETFGYVSINNKEYILTSGEMFQYGEVGEESGVYRHSLLLSTFPGIYGSGTDLDTITKDIAVRLSLCSSSDKKLENGNYQYNFTENSKIFNSLTLTTSRQGYGGENYYEASSCALEVLKQGSVYQFSFAGTVNDSIEFNGYFKGELTH